MGTSPHTLLAAHLPSGVGAYDPQDTTIITTKLSQRTYVWRCHQIHCGRVHIDAVRCDTLVRAEILHLDVDNRQRTAVHAGDDRLVGVVHLAPVILALRVLFVMIPAVRQSRVRVGLRFRTESCRFTEIRTDVCRLYDELTLNYSNTV